MTESTDKNKINTRMLVESALMVAIAAVLGNLVIFRLPSGGSVTIGSMIPIMLVSLKYPFKWAFTVAMAYSLTEILTGFYAPPVGTVFYYILVVLLDYAAAFGAFSLAGPAYRILPQSWRMRLKLACVASLCAAGRFLCHFASGILIWGVYAPQGQPVWLYSLLYNGSYMLFEGLIAVVIFLAAGERMVRLYVGDRSI